MKDIKEIRVGVVITIAGVFATGTLAWAAWVSNTLYSQNGSLNSVSASVVDVQNTTHAIENILLNRNSVSVK